MYRYLLEDLIHWLGSDGRKPLVLRGARQVGKTWLVRELAKYSNKQLIELNFEKQANLLTHFVSNEPNEILVNLQSALNTSIEPENCILFLDEIQVHPELLAKLRWFYELMPELPVVTAGSLLEFTLANYHFSMPVGRIHYMFVQPLGFEEFLLAKDEMYLLDAIRKFDTTKPFNEALHEKASQLFKEYVVVGGMPEAVVSWIKNQSLLELAMVHNNLLNTYKDDFSKYAGRLSLEYLSDSLQAIPRLLGKKIIYSHVNSTGKHASIKQSINLLTQACLCHKVQATYANGIPLGAELNAKNFKVILLDIGLVVSLLGLNLHQFTDVNELLLVNKGGLAEQVVGQLLCLLYPFYQEPSLYYWARENKSSSAEVDYLLQHKQDLVPIEVKAGHEGKMRSLHQFMAEKPWKKAVRYYAGEASSKVINIKTTKGEMVSYSLMSLPFYLVEQTQRLLS